jgi:uncharacterized lipoprotein YajG
MKRRLRFAIATWVLGILSATLLAGCGSPGATTVSTPTAIRVSGNVVGTTIVLDDRLVFQISGKDGRMVFTVTPGRHHVRVERSGAAVLDQTVSVSKGQTLEVAVP